jgi:5-methylcytosine-specific restriction protein A
MSYQNMMRGPDAREFVAAVCPNCHREVHHGANGKSLNEKLASLIQMREAGR